jgi:hypothetical protein
MGAVGGSGGDVASSSDSTPGTGATASGGDLNINGGSGSIGNLAVQIPGYKGRSFYDPTYGDGADGQYSASGTKAGTAGQTGIVIITEY